ncbi:MAG: HEAT repeat domain-containing protein, partial [Candidatus Omnitrophica bacterium]|nr:HEAT repeat domain-containing protein [Candidatus Omnitrophota bacterium]
MNTDSSSKPPSALNTVYRLFLIPLMIVVVSVGLFYWFGRMTFETKSPEDFLYEIKTGGDSRKWQAAYSLAGLLITEKNISEENKKEYTKEIIPIFENQTRYNVQVRSYLALALGYLGQKEAVPALRAALDDSHEDVALYSLWALAVMKPEIANQEGINQKLCSFLEDARPPIRKMAAFALGALKDPSAARALQAALKDPVADVSWNAALSLASLGDASGAAVLERMLDRKYLDTFPALTEREKEGILLNVIRAA